MVKPQDFAAITTPRSRGEEGTGMSLRPCASPPRAQAPAQHPLPSAPKATLILNSIGSLSKSSTRSPSSLRHGVGVGHESGAIPTPTGWTGPSAPPPRNEEVAHRVLEELDDEREAPRALTSPGRSLEKLRRENPADTQWVSELGFISLPLVLLEP